MTGRSSRWRDVAWILLVLASAALAVVRFPAMWPLASADIAARPQHLPALAEELAHALGAMRTEAAAVDVRIDEPTLRALAKSADNAAIQRAIAADLPVFYRRFTIADSGAADALVIEVASNGRIIGWQQHIDDAASGPRLERAAAMAIALSAAEHWLGFKASDLEPSSAIEATDRPGRRDYTIHFIRHRRDLLIDERIDMMLCGGTVTWCMRTCIVPGVDQRLRPIESGSWMIAAVVAAVALLAAMVACVRAPRAARRGLVGDALVALAMIVAWWLSGAWSRIGATAWAGGAAFVLLMAGGRAVRALVAPTESAPDAAWRALLAGRLRDRSIARAAGAGAAIAALCGAAAALVHLLLSATGSHTLLQPRGFLFFPLTGPRPIAVGACLAVSAVLIEESYYRLFLIPLATAVLRSRVAAVILSALLFALAHASFAFVPPAYPWWGRVALMFAVGLVLGWAFVRYGLLAAIVAHLICDLSILAWPQLASGLAAQWLPALAWVVMPPFFLAAPALLTRTRSTAKS